MLGLIGIANSDREFIEMSLKLSFRDFGLTYNCNLSLSIPLITDQTIQKHTLLVSVPGSPLQLD